MRRQRSAWEVGHSFIQELGRESRASKGLGEGMAREAGRRGEK